MQSVEAVILDSRGLTSGTLEQIAVGGAGLVLGPELRARVSAARQSSAAPRSRPAVNAANNAWRRASPRAMDPPDHSSSMTGVTEELRAIMATRAATLAVNPDPHGLAELDVLLGMLARHALPTLPANLTAPDMDDLLEALSTSLTGVGRVRLADGSHCGALSFIRSMSLSPLVVSVSDSRREEARAALVALNHVRMDRACRWAVVLTLSAAECMRLQGLPGRITRVSIGPQLGQRRVGGWLAGLQADQRYGAAIIVVSNAAVGEQGPQSGCHDPIGCTPSLYGAVLDAIAQHHAVSERLLRAGPLHDATLEGELSRCTDALANAVVSLAMHAHQRLAGLTDPVIAGGYPASGGDGGAELAHALMGAQFDASALLLEMHERSSDQRQYADCSATLDGRLRRCSHLIDLLYQVLAVEALATAWVMDQSALNPAGHGVVSRSTMQMRNLAQSGGRVGRQEKASAADVHALAADLRRPGALAPWAAAVSA